MRAIPPNFVGAAVILSIMVSSTASIARAGCAQGADPSAPFIGASDMMAIDHAARALPFVPVARVPMDVGSIVPPAVKLAMIPAPVVNVLAQYAGYQAYRSSHTLVIVNRSSRAIAYLLPLGQGANAACPG